MGAEWHGLGETFIFLQTDDFMVFKTSEYNLAGLLEICTYM